jgi:hypothetical protein
MNEGQVRQYMYLPSHSAFRRFSSDCCHWNYRYGMVFACIILECCIICFHYLRNFTHI